MLEDFRRFRATHGLSNAALATLTLFFTNQQPRPGEIVLSTPFESVTRPIDGGETCRYTVRVISDTKTGVDPAAPAGSTPSGARPRRSHPGRWVLAIVCLCGAGVYLWPRIVKTGNPAPPAAKSGK